MNSDRDMRQFGGASLLSLLNAVTSAIAGLLVARLLGASGYGQYTYVVTVASFASLAAGMGTGISLRLRTAGSTDMHQFEAYAAFSSVASVLSGVMVAIFVLLLPPAGQSFDWVSIGAILLFGMLITFARQAMDATQARGALAKALLSASIASGFLGLFAGGALALGLQLSGSWILLVAGLGFLVQLAFVAVTRPRVPMWPSTWSFRAIRGLALEGRSGMGFHIGLSALQRSSRILGVVILGPATGGVYAVASTLSESSRLLSNSLGQVVFLKVSGGNATIDSTRRLRFVGIAVNIGVALSLGLGGNWLIEFGFGEEFRRASVMLWPLLLGEVFMGSAIFDARVALGHGRVTQVAAATMFIGVTAVVAVALAAYVWRIEGVLVATVISYAAFAFIMRRTATRLEESRG